MTYKICTLVIGLTAILFTSCLSDGDDTMVLEKGEKNEFVDGDQTVVVGTNEYADIENGGFTLYIPKGSVPKTNSGDNGRVAFSISHVDISDLPCQLPTGARIVGRNSIKIEPMNFTFNSPLVLKCPTGGNTNYVLLRYNDYTNSWEVVPFSSRNADGTSNVSLIETGYFVLVEYPPHPRSHRRRSGKAHRSGSCQIHPGKKIRDQNGRTYRHGAAQMSGTISGETGLPAL